MRPDVEVHDPRHGAQPGRPLRAIKVRPPLQADLGLVRLVARSRHGDPTAHVLSGAVHPHRRPSARAGRARSREGPNGAKRCLGAHDRDGSEPRHFPPSGKSPPVTRFDLGRIVLLSGVSRRSGSISPPSPEFQCLPQVVNGRRSRGRNRMFAAARRCRAPASCSRRVANVRHRDALGGKRNLTALKSFIDDEARSQTTPHSAR
jgi:hypothetical protein